MPVREDDEGRPVHFNESEGLIFAGQTRMSILLAVTRGDLQSYPINCFHSATVATTVIETNASQSMMSKNSDGVSRRSSLR